MNYELISEDNALLYNGVERIFANRGITNINKFLNPSVADCCPPDELSNVKEAVEELIKTINNSDRVGIVVDADCDGFTSSALLINYLYRLFPTWASQNLVYYLHDVKTHGLKDMVDKIIKSDVKLVLIPDAGSGNGVQGQQLLDVGIKSIMIDHHKVKYENTEPIIIVSNQLGYGNPTLSGVGVVYKFCSYIDNLLNIHIADDYLDLVAVGDVADIMDITHPDSVYLIRKGMDNFRNPFLGQLAVNNEYSINKNDGLNPFTIGFYIAPFINAIVRSGTMEEQNLIFRAMLDIGGEEKVPSTKRGHKGEMIPCREEAARVAANVKNRQTKERDEAVEKIEKIIKQDNLLENKLIIVKMPNSLNINKNITGLVANILAEKYQRPVMLLSEIEFEGIKCWGGSCRNCDYSVIEDFNQFLQNLPEVYTCLGHSSAFGAFVYYDKFDDFINHTNQILEGIKFVPVYHVDFIWKKDADWKTVFDIGNMKSLYGKGFSEPYIVIEDVIITKENSVLFNKGVMKVNLPSGISIVKFNVEEEEYQKMFSGGKTTKMTLVGKCNINNYGGEASPQILVEDCQLTTFYNF